MSLYDAIFARRSCRKFSQAPVDEDRLIHLEKYLSLIRALDPKIRTRFELVRADEVRLGGALLVSAPYYLVLYSEEAEGSRANAGYLMEQAVLYLTVYGVATCYQGGVDKKTLPAAPAGMEPVITVAFGLPEGSLSGSRARRKKLEDVCVFRDGAGSEVRKIVEAARIAPSALNRQPWFFVAAPGRIHVFCRPTPLMKGQEFDCGIALLHLMLAAEENWYTPKVVQVKKLPDKLPARMSYVGTVLLETVR